MDRQVQSKSSNIGMLYKHPNVFPICAGYQDRLVAGPFGFRLL